MELFGDKMVRFVIVTFHAAFYLSVTGLHVTFHQDTALLWRPRMPCIASLHFFSRTLEAGKMHFSLPTTK